MEDICGSLILLIILIIDLLLVHKYLLISLCEVLSAVEFITCILVVLFLIFNAGSVIFCLLLIYGDGASIVVLRNLLNVWLIIHQQLLLDGVGLPADWHRLSLCVFRALSASCVHVFLDL